MSNFVLTCLLAAVVACGLISVVTNFLSGKIGTKAKTVISLVIEVLVSLLVFWVNALVAAKGITYGIVTIIIGVIITVGFSQIAYSTIIKFFDKVIAKFKDSIAS